MIYSLLKFKTNTKINHKVKRVNPHTSWLVLLRFVFTIIILLIAGSLFLMYQIRNEKIFTANTDSVVLPSVLNENLLEKVNNSFDKRLNTQEIIKSNDGLYKDPSLK